MIPIPTALTIAGSDSGGGAGIQADLKTFSAHGVYGASAITGLTAQNTLGVLSVEPVSNAMIAAQIRAVLDDIPMGAVKIGMLGTADIVETVAAALSGYHGPIVLDPVMVAKSGDPLLAEDAIAALIRDLLPRAAILTPNLPEAARLLGTEAANSPDDAEAQGRALLALGPGAVLMKGGHGAGAVCTDLLVSKAGMIRHEAARIHTRNTHGTGCSLSSAIAAQLAKGRELKDAVHHAHLWLHEAIAHADRLDIGAGHGPVHHFHEVWT